MGNPGWRHERIKSTQFLSLLIVYLERHPIGSASSESQFTMAGGGARIPDVAFVSRSKLAPLLDEDIAIPFAPDLAIEIISNSEIAARAEKKVREYLASGVQEVWQVYPADRFVRVRTADGIRDLGEDQFLETPVLPGFQGYGAGFSSLAERSCSMWGGMSSCAAVANRRRSLRRFALLRRVSLIDPIGFETCG